jgi:hypothetical protein
MKKIYHVKDLHDRIIDIEWLAKALDIDLQKFPNFNGKSLEEDFWKWLEKENLTKRFKIYIGSYDKKMDK